MRLTIDSFAWVEMIRGTPLGAEAQLAIRSAAACFTPSFVLAEVAYRCARDGFDDRQVAEELRAIGESATVVPIRPEISVAAARATAELRERAKAQGRPLAGLGDGIVLATARAAGSRVLTGDPHFRGLTETVWLG